jgi:hypothetical protein
VVSGIDYRRRVRAGPVLAPFLVGTLTFIACTEPRGAADAGLPDAPTDATPPDAGACPAPPTVAVAPGSTRKLCQLTGETDRQLAAPAPNRTETRANLVGTDLGASFEHRGSLWFLFGDTLPTLAGQQAMAYVPWRDSMATSATTDPASCVALDFEVTDVDGGTYYRNPLVQNGAGLVDLGAFDVPLHGLSTGASMYVWLSTNCMSTSLLARSDDAARTFTLVHVLSDCGCGSACNVDPARPKPQADPAACANVAGCRFVNVQAAVVPAARAAGLPGFAPGAPADQLVLFGSGPFRSSDVYLASAPLASIEDETALRYFAGTSPGTCAPAFDPDEANAAPLFTTAGESPAGGGPCVGEVSAHFSDALGLWLVLYNCGNRIDLRAARDPWGPYSELAVVLDPTEGAYCSYMYEADAGCDQLSDPTMLNGPNGGLGDSGGVYGPYAIPRFTTKTAAGATLTFVTSVHNPYEVMLLQTDLVAE